MYYQLNGSGDITNQLRDHLRKYDRFYSDCRHEDSHPLGRSVVYKLAVAGYCRLRGRIIRRNIMDPASEAMQVTKAIFAAMNDTTRGDGTTFVLAVLPAHSDLVALREESSYRDQWNRMVDALDGNGYHCVDLSGYLLREPAEAVDRSYDLLHFGPRANRIIAKSIDRVLSESNILDQE
jgi:hypothetical protein